MVKHQLYVVASYIRFWRDPFCCVFSLVLHLLTCLPVGCHDHACVYLRKLLLTSTSFILYFISSSLKKVYSFCACITFVLEITLDLQQVLVQDLCVQQAAVLGVVGKGAQGFHAL